MEENILTHYGVKGMKWGVRKEYVPHPRKKQGSRNVSSNIFDRDKDRFLSKNKIIKNKDGSLRFPKGFVFNRVGQSTMGVNQSGALYASSGVDDAARYVKYLGPTLMGKLLGTAGTTIHNIEATKDLRMPSDEQMSKNSAEFLKNNQDVLKRINDSLYSYPFENGIDRDILDKAISDPKSDTARKISYCLVGPFGDSEYSKEAQKFYNYMRSKNFDALPDVNDVLAGTSTSAVIVINPDKLKVKSSITITKEVMNDAKRYVKTLEKLKVSDLLK